MHYYKGKCYCLILGYDHLIVSLTAIFGDVCAHGLYVFMPCTHSHVIFKRPSFTVGHWMRSLLFCIVCMTYPKQLCSINVWLGHTHDRRIELLICLSFTEKSLINLTVSNHCRPSVSLHPNWEAYQTSVRLSPTLQLCRLHLPCHSVAKMCGICLFLY